MIDALIQLRSHLEARRGRRRLMNILWAIPLAAATVFTARAAVAAWTHYATAVPAPSRIDFVFGDVIDGKVRNTYVVDGRRYFPLIGEDDGLATTAARWIGADGPDFWNRQSGDPVTVWKSPGGGSTLTRRVPIVLTLSPLFWSLFLLLMIWNPRPPTAKLIDDVLAGRRTLVPTGYLEDCTDRHDGSMEVRIRPRHPFRRAARAALIFLLFLPSILFIPASLGGAWFRSEEIARAALALAFPYMVLSPLLILLVLSNRRRFTKKGGTLAIDGMTLDRAKIEEVAIRPEGPSERLDIRIRNQRRPIKIRSNALWYASLLDQEGIPIRFKN